MSHSQPPLANEPRSRRCPRCGARLGALSPGDRADDATLYCGCCGLVVPDSSTPSGAGADTRR